MPRAYSPRAKKPLCKRGHTRTPDNLTVNNHCRMCDRQQVKKYADKRWERQILDLYGMTRFDYESMLADQDFKCAICGKPRIHMTTRLQVDHDHETGKIRGLLCPTCNGKILVVLERYPYLIDKAKAYLRGEKNAPI
jgi:DNA-directed RNA polymerase subunit RPC12/RpoP